MVHMIIDQGTENKTENTQRQLIPKNSPMAYFLKLSPISYIKVLQPLKILPPAGMQAFNT